MKRTVRLAFLLIIASLCSKGYFPQVIPKDDDIARWKKLAYSQSHGMTSTTDNHWARLYIGPESDYLHSINPTLDGGYIIAGDKRDGGARKAFAMKLNKYGNVEWKQNFRDEVRNIFFDWNWGDYAFQADDGGYILLGSSWTWTSSAQSGMVVKLLPDGNIEWSHYFGTGVRFDSGMQTNDRGFIISGLMADKFGDQEKDLWILKLSNMGALEWQKTIGGEGQEADWVWNKRTSTIIQTADGGFLLTCDSDSFSENEWPDLWLIKLSETGNVIWQKSYGGSESEYMNRWGPHVCETPEGNIFLLGNTLSFFGPEGYTTLDVWVLKLSSAGEILWQRKYDAGKGELARSMQLASDGGLIITGGTTSAESIGGDEAHIFLFKLSAQGNIEWQRAYSYDSESGEEAHFVCPSLDGGFTIGGYTGIHQDVLILKVSEEGSIQVPGCILAYPIIFTARNTNAVPKITTAESKEIMGSAKITNIFAEEAQFVQYVICWNLHQPPVNVRAEQRINRGLFGGEVLQYIKWAQNPENSEFMIMGYRIYRKPADSNDSRYQLLGTVPAGVFEFYDDTAQLPINYTYMVMSIDAEGNESPWSEPVTPEK